MICASCFCSHLSPCQALAEALEQNSTLTDLNLEVNFRFGGMCSETLEAWCLAFQYLEPGSQVSKSRASRVLHKPHSKVL